MKLSLVALIRDVSLVTLALGLALGWSLYQIALGVAYFVEDISIHGALAASDGRYAVPVTVGAFTWVVRGRILNLDQLVMGLIDLGSILAIALLIESMRRRLHAGSEPSRDA